LEAVADVRSGSEADICSAKANVRFTPDSDRESRHPHKVMSAMPPKADVCGARSDVRLGPEADILGRGLLLPRNWRIGFWDFKDFAR
jgi:hypothetical protein